MTGLVDLATQGASLLRGHAAIAPGGVTLPLHFGLLGRGFELALDWRLHLLHCPDIALPLLAPNRTFGARLVAIAAATLATLATLAAFTVTGECRQAARCQDDRKNNLKR